MTSESLGLKALFESKLLTPRFHLISWLSDVTKRIISPAAITFRPCRFESWVSIFCFPYKTPLLRLKGRILQLKTAMKVALILASSIFVISSLSSLGQAAGSPPSCFDESVKVNSIPENHLYHKKNKPLVIGHHGNPSKYQENTVDGFKSLVELKADGMEFDTFLTKDEKLVVIHYENTKVSFFKNDYVFACRRAIFQLETSLPC